MKRDYLHKGEYVLAMQIRKVAEELSEPNRGYVLAFGAKLGLLNRKPQTVARVIRELRAVFPYLGKDARKATKEDIERLVLYLNKSGKAVNSLRKIKQTLKSFYKWLYSADDYPALVKWIKVDQMESMKLPEELLTEDEVAGLINACRSQRDRAIISLLYDTGMRVGELLNLKVRDIVLNAESPSYAMVDGKTGKRRVTLVFSVPYLSNYLNERGRGLPPESAMFLTSHGNPFDYPNVRKLLSDLKERTGIRKRIHPHLFRHSRASVYANSMTEQQLKKYFGWTGGSQMAAVYVHLSGKDVDDAVMKANGITIGRGEPAKPRLTIKVCYKCEEVNEMTAKYCSKCHSPLDVSPVEEVNELESVKQKLDKMTRAVDLLMEKIDPQSRDAILGVLENK